MKVQMLFDGVLCIEAEDELESYALSQFCLNKTSCENNSCMSRKIIIATELSKQENEE